MVPTSRIVGVPVEKLELIVEPDGRANEQLVGGAVDFDDIVNGKLQFERQDRLRFAKVSCS